MPLIAPVIQQKLELAIIAELTASFGASADPKTVTDSHKKIAAAVAKAVAQVIVTELTTNAQVLPGIPTAGSPAAQTTVGPGKIL